MATADILELVRSRSSPGILILNLDNRVVYSNREALSFFADPENMPEEVVQLCKQLREGCDCGGNCAMLPHADGPPYSLRGFLIGGPSNGHPATHVMVMVEKVTEKHEVNFKKARTRFSLSSREVEIVALVAQGLSNKEISSKLFVSEHTVKDHLKNIMRKMNASSRSEIIAILK